MRDKKAATSGVEDDKMTSNRPYRKGLSREKGIEEIRKGSGTQFDPGIVEILLKVLADS